jgi:DDE superfamily endonuclease
MKLLEKLITKPQSFQRTFGLSYDQFQLFVSKVKPLWDRAEKRRKKRSEEIRKAGGGRQYALTLEQMIGAVLCYYKTYVTQEFLGFVIGLDQSNVSRLLRKMVPLMEQAADPELAAYLAKAKEEFDKIPMHQRTKDWDTFLKKYPDLQDVSTDATEQQCHRSQDNATQKKYYSGKTKQHSLKTQISASSTGKIVNVSSTVPGSIHDKKLADQEKTIQKFPEKTVQRLDAGYQGTKEDNPQHYVVATIKKKPKQERSPLEKELNRANSKRRIVVEHALSRIKKFKILGGLYRGVIAQYNAIFRTVAALLNFKLVHPAAI